MHVLVKKLRINYTRQGTGKTILLLHGWGVDLTSFDSLAEHLAKNFEVIRLDFPGFGNSDTPTVAWTVQDYAKFIEDFLASAEVPTLHAVIGHSFGGRVIIKLHEQNKLDVEKIVFMGSAGIKPRANLQTKVTKIVAGLIKPMTKIPLLSKATISIISRAKNRLESLDYKATTGPMRQTFLNVINEDLTPSLSLIKKPTLLIWGAEDHDTTLSDARLFHAHIKTSKLRILQNAGHFVFNDKPRKVNAWIESFLS